MPQTVALEVRCERAAPGAAVTRTQSTQRDHPRPKGPETMREAQPHSGKPSKPSFGLRVSIRKPRPRAHNHLCANKFGARNPNSTLRHKKTATPSPTTTYAHAARAYVHLLSDKSVPAAPLWSRTPARRLTAAPSPSALTLSDAPKASDLLPLQAQKTCSRCGPQARNGPRGDRIPLTARTLILRADHATPIHSSTNSATSRAT